MDQAIQVPERTTVRLGRIEIGTLRRWPGIDQVRFTFRDALKDHMPNMRDFDNIAQFREWLSKQISELNGVA